MMDDRLGPALRAQLEQTSAAVDEAERRRRAAQQATTRQLAPAYLDAYEEELAREQGQLEARLADVKARRARYRRQVAAAARVDGEAIDRQRLAAAARQQATTPQQRAQARLADERYQQKVAAGIVPPADE